MQKTRICTVCKKEFPATTEYFHKSPRGKYGVHSQCKVCRLKERKKRYNREVELGIPQHYYLSNRTPYLVRAMKKRGYTHLTDEIYDEIINNFKTDNGKSVCPYCNREMEDERMIHVDHFIPYSDGGADIMTNLIPTCMYCNRSKMNLRFSDWFRDQFFYSKEREKKVLSYFYGRKLKKYFPAGHVGRVVSNGINEENDNYEQITLYK